jgi:hypothetical protein
VLGSDIGDDRRNARLPLARLVTALPVTSRCFLRLSAGRFRLGARGRLNGLRTSSVPLAGAGTSESTLSLSTSSSGSYSSTRSPTCFSHAPTVPSTTLSPSWGMMTSVAMKSPRFVVMQ